MEATKIVEMIIDDFECLKEDIEDLEKAYRDKSFNVDNENVDYDILFKYLGKAKEISLFKEKLLNLTEEFSSLISEEVENDSNLSIDEFVDLDNFTFTDPIQIKILDKVFDVKKNWRVVLITVLEEMIRRKPVIVKRFDQNSEFKGRKRSYFSYNENELRFPHKLSNNLFVETNLSANFIGVLCKRVIKECGFDPAALKFKIDDIKEELENEKLDISYEKNDEIKLPKKYASLHIPKELFKKIINEIVEYDLKYKDEYIIPSKIKDALKDEITNNTAYSIPYHVIINIISYLKDFQFIDNYPGTQKGKYILKDKNALNTWVNSVI